MTDYRALVAHLRATESLAGLTPAQALGERV